MCKTIIEVNKEVLEERNKWIKVQKIVKKLLALFLVVLTSIESFGAILGDNDGSAFITKAEFDSQVKEFNTEINRYETSIDTKLQGGGFILCWRN